MISARTGHVANGLYVAGLSWSPVFLLDSSRPILFEAGFSCAARLYERDIRHVLDKKSPEVLFITHVHWDHCGTTGHLQRSFPGLKVAASKEAASIVSRPSAQRRMTELGRTVIPTVRTFEGQDAVDQSLVVDEPFEAFAVDVPLEDGQVIEVSQDLHVQVVATPGHTRDHVSFYIPERKIIIGGEAAGCLEPAGTIDVEFLVDYDAYLASLKRLRRLPAEVFTQGHHYVFVGQESVEQFLDRSIEATERFASRVQELLRSEAGDVEQVMRRIKVEEYDPKPGLKQPDDAYLLNLRAQVTHLAERMKRG